MNEMKHCSNKSTCLLVASNPGGAAILAAWAAKQKKYHFRFYLNGGAPRVFSRYFQEFENLWDKVDLKKLIYSCERVICATSTTGSNIEKEAIIASRSLGVHVSAYLDHWVDYKKRFYVNQEYVWPDELWVGDVYGFDLARKTFPHLKIEYVENQIFQDLAFRRESSVSNKKNDGITALYLSEYNSEDERQNSIQGNEDWWDENETVRYFLRNVTSIVPHQSLKKIVFRVHPLETNSKYDWVFDEFPELPLEFSAEKELVDDCLAADIIIGRETMAMVEALYLGKLVISCVPPKMKKGALPFKEIFDMETLIRQEINLPLSITQNL